MKMQTVVVTKADDRCELIKMDIFPSDFIRKMEQFERLLEIYRNDREV